MTKKVLIVEDNELNMKLFHDLLEAQGYETLETREGLAALSLAREHRPDLILMDMSLPVLDGWEATRRLKNDPRTRHIPIVALTGHALAGHAEGAREAGCDAFVTKPCLPDALVTEINRLLDAHRANAENVKDSARSPKSTKKRS